MINIDDEKIRYYILDDFKCECGEYLIDTAFGGAMCSLCGNSYHQEQEFIKKQMKEFRKKGKKIDYIDY